MTASFFLDACSHCNVLVCKMLDRNDTTILLYHSYTSCSIFNHSLWCLVNEMHVNQCYSDAIVHALCMLMFMHGRESAHSSLVFPCSHCNMLVCKMIDRNGTTILLYRSYRSCSTIWFLWSSVNGCFKQTSHQCQSALCMYCVCWHWVTHAIAIKDSAHSSFLFPCLTTVASCLACTAGWNNVCAIVKYCILCFVSCVKNTSG